MHIAFGSHRYAPVPGGTERTVQTIAESLVRRGHRASVVTQLEPGTPERETLHGVEVRRVPTRAIAGVRVPRGYLATLRSLDADVFHLHGNRIWCADFYFPVARRFRWAQLLTGHGFYQYAIRPTPIDRWYFERYLPKAIARFDRYTCDTEFECSQLLRWGVNPALLELVPLGAPLDEFVAAAPDPASLRARYGLKSPNVAVYAGGFFENKRVDRLVEAVGRTKGSWALLAIGRDVEGSPFDRARCAERARELGVEFVAPGALERPPVVEAIRAADVVLLGSDYEGFGVLLAEALAAGRPFIAWNGERGPGAAPEMAKTGGGFVVRSLEEFSSRLTELESPQLRGAMGARGRSAASRFSVEAMVDRFEALYRKILDERRSA